MTSRKPSSATVWTTVAVLVALVGYPLSIGPAWRCSAAIRKPPWLGKALNSFYAPLWAAADYAPSFLWNALYEYETWGAYPKLPDET